MKNAIIHAKIKTSSVKRVAALGISNARQTANQWGCTLIAPGFCPGVYKQQGLRPRVPRGNPSKTPCLSAIFRRESRGSKKLKVHQVESSSSYKVTECNAFMHCRSGYRTSLPRDTRFLLGGQGQRVDPRQKISGKTGN